LTATENTIVGATMPNRREAVQLPLLARAYVGGVIATGLVICVYAATQVLVTQASLFISLVILSCLASTLKVRLPLTRSASTMSVSYVVDFTALLLLGPEQTVFVAAASAVAQSTLNVRKGNPDVLQHRCDRPHN
jgi:hypothetical protein